MYYLVHVDELQVVSHKLHQNHPLIGFGIFRVEVFNFFFGQTAGTRHCRFRNKRPQIWKIEEVMKSGSLVPNVTKRVSENFVRNVVVERRFVRFRSAFGTEEKGFEKCLRWIVCRSRRQIDVSLSGSRALYVIWPR